MSIYLSSAYFAPIEYYSFLYNCKDIIIEQHENYIKQTYRSRCNILSANGALSLSLPIEASDGKKCLIKDIRIADHGNWHHLHWNALISAYNSTPFFEYYEDEFRPFFEKKYTFLFDLNEEIRNTVCKLLQIDTSVISYTDKYIQEVGEGYDMRGIISPKKDWKISNSYFISVPYYQVFSYRYGFTENLSIVDLLFNMGNESQIILEKSIKKEDISKVKVAHR